MTCSETQYTIFVSPRAVPRAIQQYGYTESDISNDADKVKNIINNQMLVEHASCAYVQLMPSEADIDRNFNNLGFLQRHSQILEDDNYL